MHSATRQWSRLAILVWTALGILGLVGCVSQNPVRPDPAATALTLGEVTLRAAQSESPSHKPERIAETSSFDESKSFRHWQAYFYFSATCDTHERCATQFLRNYAGYCALRGGGWTVAGSSKTGICTGPKPFEIRVSVATTANPLIANSRFFYLLVDAFDRREGMPGSITDEYALGVATRADNSYDIFGKNNPTSLNFSAYVKRDFAAEKQTLEARKLAAERERSERAAAAAAKKLDDQMRQKTAEMTYLPKTKTIGQQICRMYSGEESHQTRMGYTYAKTERSYRVTGYTEKVEGQRIQIRIGSVESFNVKTGEIKNVPELGGSPVLKAGAIIWDDPVEWKPCS